jgi:hypothetical protein
MFSTQRARFSKKWFNFTTRNIFRTEMVQCDPTSNVVILSQLYSPDLNMYMLAAKSFARFIKPLEFVIVDDGLLPSDKQILSKHFKQIRFVPTNRVKSSACPKGGCWERLLSIAELSAAHYVIQLDADTLTLSVPDEVKQCIAENRSFTLGTSTGQEITTLRKASEFARQHPGEHVQIQAEIAMENYPGNERLHYVRGCAGFAGFSRGLLSVTKVEEFSTNMSSLIGKEKWSGWGSEQVTSNYLIANAPNPLVLPLKGYTFWAPSVDASQCKLIHFVGTYRFYHGEYMNLARSIIKELKNIPF